MDKEEKQKYKAFFKAETGIFIIEKLTRNIIECCKLPEPIELRKNLIDSRKQQKIVEKIKLFPEENIALN